MSTPLRTTPCRRCGAAIGFIQSGQNRSLPVDPEALMRHSAVPFPVGEYVDMYGERYSRDDVPMKVTVFKVHPRTCDGKPTFGRKGHRL